jgi:hypothetical protein
MNRDVHRFKQIFGLLTLLSLLAVSLAGFLLAPHNASAAGGSVTYAGDFSSVFPNPDRGYHNRYEIINDPNVNDYATNNSIAGFSPDMLDRTFSRAKADGDTLIHSYVHLDKYQTTDIPQELLDNLNSGLAAIRAAGLKIILRVAYAWNSNPTAVTEAEMEHHMDQLSPVLTANADVIDHLEAGFLGEWGEWHDGPYTDAFDRSQADVRYRLVKKLLSVTPATIPIAIRYPIFIKEISQLPVPAGCTLPDNCQLTQSDLDRLGFHDDCFLSDSADMGTYDQNSWMGWFDVSTKRSWVTGMTTSFGGNQMVGGETCDSAGDDDAACVNAQYQMSIQHWTEINQDYAPVNVNIWKNANLAASGNDPAETCFTRIQRKLGYRLRLVDATFPTTATAGGGFTFSADLQNDGYASPIEQRPLYLVLDNGTNRYNLPLSDVDVRTWLSGANSIAAHTLTLPASMPAGTYKLALWLPDHYSDLQSQPAYSIRLANLNTWDATNGYNVLSTAITIGPACTANCPPTPTPTPMPSPTPSPTPAPFNLSIEAEDSGNTLGGGATIEGCSACSGGKGVGYIGYGTSNAYLVFNNVTAPASGQYRLTLYYMSDTDRTADITVNGTAVQTVSFPSTGSFQTLGSVSTTVTLKQGGNTLKYSNASTRAPDLDRIVLTNGSGSGTPTPTPTPGLTPTMTPTNTPTPTPTNTPTPTPTTGPFNLSIEAEASSNTLVGGATIEACTACSGGKDVAYMGYGTNNAYLVFNIATIPASGQYTLTFYYASDTARTADVTINGVFVQTVNFPGTGGWGTVSSLSITVTLQQGSNTLKISNPSTRTPDLDRIVLSS